jgi:hypothetical protein
MFEITSGWLSAGAASLTLLGVGVNWSIIRPIAQKLEAQSAEMREHKKAAELSRDKQERLVVTAGTEQKLASDDIRKRLEQHERNDTERFDDTGERMLSMIDGLRKEMVLGHTNSVAQMKTDTDRGFNSVREDLRALTARFDSLAATLTDALSRR